MPEEKKLNIEEYINVLRSKVILNFNGVEDLVKQSIGELYSMLDTQLKLNESLRNQITQKEKEIVELKKGNEPADKKE